MTNLNCKYLLDACYSCQKCLYCFEFPQEESCKCDKNKQLSRTKHLKCGQQIYQCIFTPNSSFPKANQYMSEANDKNADKKKVALNNLSNEKDAENDDKVGDYQTISLVSSDTYEEEDIDNVEVEDEDSDLEEIKMQIIVKINLVVQKTLREKITSKDYVISYKAVNIHGPLNELKDELDFQRFISEYKRIVLNGKKMSIIVAVRDNLTKKKKLHNKSFDESGFSSAEELQYTKKKKITCHLCNAHATPYFIQDNCHLQLDSARLQLWAQEIVVNQTLPTTSTTIIIQLPSQFYSNCTFQDQLTSSNFNNTNSIHLTLPNTLPLIGKFLNSLDKKYNCNIYSNFENTFLEEEITINIIKDLSDNQLQKLGVVKIGWQKNIKQAA
ncbi:hypothetical protein C1646_774952 [Rhizophagus diaphanus]|nr:hypothetical protein C1646_774952 [Rhizophagus diaphanus] [Rhizophagus sp. MUCL 43196]